MPTDPTEDINPTETKCQRKVLAGEWPKRYVRDEPGVSQ